MPHVFSLCLKKTTHKYLKVAAAETILSNVCVIGKPCFSMNVSYFMWQLEDITILLFTKAYRCFETFLTAMLLLSLKPVFWRKSVFYAYLYNDNNNFRCLHKVRKHMTDYTLLLYRCHQVRSSHLEVFCKKGALRNFTKFTGKHLCQRLFFNKVAGFIKKETLTHVFYIEHLWWLLLSSIFIWYWIQNMEQKKLGFLLSIFCFFMFLYLWFYQGRLIKRNDFS